MVLCLFFSHPSKKQLSEQQKSRMSQFEQWEHVEFCQKLGRSTSETFQMIKQAYSEEALSHNAVYK
jgi:hypothetical protein